MAIPRRNMRGLQDIRTLSGSVDQIAEPYRAYMRISCLEMEKVRRGKERESAMHRVNNIDTRFQEIEEEKELLLHALDRSAGRNHPVKGGRLEPKSRPARGTGGFKITY